MADNGGLNFAIGFRMDEYEAQAEQIKQGLREIGQSAISEGKHIDEVFSDLSKGFDVSTIEERLNALRKVISENENVIVSLTDDIKRMGEEAQTALANEDYATFRSLQQDILKAQESITDISAQTADYKHILGEIEQAAGQISSQTNEPRTLFYVDEKDYERVKQLTASIAELQVELSRTSDDESFAKVNAQIIEAQDEINKLQGEASAAAKALGEDLGGRAAEASTRLYDLKAAVKEQKETYKELSDKLKEVSQALEKATKDGDAEKVKSLQLEYQSLSQNVENARTRLDNLNAAQSDAAVNWQNVNGEVSQHNSLLVKMMGGTENYSKVMAQLPAPMQQMVGGLNNMTGAAKAFIATPLGAILGVLLLAYQAIKTAINGSAEGQRNFAVVSGYVTGVLNQLKEVVISVGNFLLKLFVKPKEAGEDFLTFIKDKVIGTLMNLGELVGSLGKLFLSLFTFDKDKIKQASQDLKDTWNATFGSVIDDLNDKAQKKADIAAERLALQQKQSTWKITKAKLQGRQNELNAVMYDSSKSVDERKQAMEEYEKLIDRIADTEIGFLNKEIDLQRREMALTSSTIQDQEKLNGLIAQREQRIAEQKQSHSSLQRRRNSINSAENKEQNQEDAIADETLKLRRDRQKAEIDLIENGVEGKIAAINHAYDKEMDAIAKRERELRQKQGGELTEEQHAEINGLTNAAVRKREKDIQQTYNDALADYLTFEQKRQQIAEEYAKKRADVIAAGGTQENVDNVNRAEGLSLSDLLAQNDANYKAWLDSITGATVIQMQKMLAAARDALTKMPTEDLTEEQQKEVDRLKAKIAELEQGIANANLSPKQQDIEKWKQMSESLSDLASQCNSVAEQIGGVAGDIISGIGDVFNFTSTAMEGAAKLAAEGISTIEKASIILTIASTAMQLVNKINKFLGNGEPPEFAEQINATKKWKEHIEELQHSYDRLQKSIEGKFGKNKTNGLTAMLKVQIALMDEYSEKVKKLEETKAKKKDSVWYRLWHGGAWDEEDEAELKEYKQSLEEASDNIESLREQALDALYGKDIQTAITEFSDALADAWTNGTSSAKTAADFIREQMRSVVMESLKAAIQASGKMEKIRELAIAAVQKSLGEYDTTDMRTHGRKGGGVSGIINELQYLTEQLDDELKDKFKPVFDQLGLNDRTASAKGIATASQESIDELNGRMTAVQGHTFNINENTQIIRDNVAAINSSVAAIEGYTQHLVRMDRDIHEMHDIISGNQGIMIRS